MTRFDPDILLDHMVINARVDMDAAQAVFEALGFTVTPRGHHTLGSINHLMIFESDYLELLGLPRETPDARPELASAPMTINGLVFKTGDADATYRHLCDLGMDGDPPRSFSRPVEVDGEQREAAFRTVTVRGDVFGGGRVYFCQHRTPECLWHRPWMAHANGVRRTDAFVVAAADAEGEAARYGALLDREPEPAGDGVVTVDLGAAALEVMTPEAYRRRFAELALTAPAQGTAFGAIALGCDSLDGLERVIERPPAGCRVRRADDAVQVAVDQFGTVLEFRG